MLNLFQARHEAESVNEPVFNRGCFGKAEFQNDFIQFGVDDTDLVQFRKQLRDVASMIARSASSKSDAVYRQLPDIYFILMNPEQISTNAGIISPRVDLAGRHFPLVIFNSIRNCRLKRQTSAVPVLLQEFFGQSLELLLTDLKNMDLLQLQTSVENLPIVSRDLTRHKLFDSVMDLLKGTDVREFWHKLPIENDPAERARFITTIMVLIKTVIKQSPAKTPWGIRIPLPKVDFLLPYVVLYIQLIESRLKDCTWQAQVFWNGSNDHQSAALTVFFKEVSSSMLYQLFDPNVRDRLIIDVLDEMKRYDKPTEQAFTVTGNDKDSLMDALFKWVGFD